jgi:hypothetical protein
MESASTTDDESTEVAHGKGLNERERTEDNNNNNTFTWSGPSGVSGCTGQARIARLGQAPREATHPSE